MMTAPPIQIINARTHNLKGVSVEIPRQRFVVVTGVSGGGKSSLIFDTLYREGRRRFLETFSPYIRRFMPNPPRPPVDKIAHLGPVIALSQQGVSSNPRSTLGTTTEIYDLLRVLYARAARGYSPQGRPLQQFTFSELTALIQERFKGQKIGVWAPLVKQRRGHYAHLFTRLRALGYRTVRIDGHIYHLNEWNDLRLSRYQIHDIEVMVDVLTPRAGRPRRLENALQRALEMGKGEVYISDGEGRIHYFSRELIDPETGFSLSLPDPNFFSFNLERGRCPQCLGIGTEERFQQEALQALSLHAVLTEIDHIVGSPGYFLSFFRKALKPHGISLNQPLGALSDKEQKTVWEGTGEVVEFYWRPHGYFTLTFEGLHGLLKHWDNDVRAALAEKGWVRAQTCRSCGGTRIRPEARLFRIGPHDLGALALRPIRDVQAWLDELPRHLDEKGRRVAAELVPEIQQKVEFLLNTGLDYLHLHRPLFTLSGGELQRVRLAQYIGQRMTRIIYILDEPSIGLHPADNHKMIASLQQLRDLGNSVIVVEHDRDTMLAADHIIDLGPGQGKAGGYVVAEGPPEAILQSSTLTGEYLRRQRTVGSPSTHLPDENTPRLVLRGARGHNLQHIDVSFPLGHFICITGLSGSGKSSLVMETLYPALARKRGMAAPPPLPFSTIEGDETVEGVYAVDQQPIGRTARSIPATYIGVYNHIRDLFASLPAARFHGLEPSHFSFNVKGGRCETCKGAGVVRVEMKYLSGTWVRCPDCRGRRFQPAVLHVHYKGQSIHDVLEMTVDEAAALFADRPRIAQKLALLQEVGLGYIQLGQPSPTLSGGESQRLKIVRALARRRLQGNLFILDEPTTGLHFHDIDRLLDAIRMLVGRGNTVIAIEHNMELVAAADYVIDLGPGTGPEGGRVVAAGTPAEVAAHPDSITGHYLAQLIEQTPLWKKASSAASSS